MNLLIQIRDVFAAVFSGMTVGLFWQMRPQKSHSARKDLLIGDLLWGCAMILPVSLIWFFLSSGNLRFSCLLWSSAGFVWMVLLFPRRKKPKNALPKRKNKLQGPQKPVSGLLYLAKMEDRFWRRRKMIRNFFVKK